MLDITSTSGLLDFQKLPTSGADYYIANNTIVFFDLTEDTITDVVDMLKSGELDDFPLMSFYLFDFYAKPKKLTKGLEKFFDYLIFDNQWFLDHDISIVCTTEKQKELVEATIETSQRTITATDEPWPVTSKQLVDMLDLKDTVKGMIRLSEGTEPPHESIRIILSLTKEYVETRLVSKDTSKSFSYTSGGDSGSTKPNYPSIELTEDEKDDGYVKDSSEPEDGIYSGELDIEELPEETADSSEDSSSQTTTSTAYLYDVYYVQHHILTMETNLLVAKFYGKSSLSMSSERPDGTVIFDINTILKKTKMYLSPDDITELEVKVKSKGGELTDETSVS